LNPAVQTPLCRTLVQHSSSSGAAPANPFWLLIAEPDCLVSVLPHSVSCGVPAPVRCAAALHDYHDSQSIIALRTLPLMHCTISNISLCISINDSWPPASNSVLLFTRRCAPQNEAWAQHCAGSRSIIICMQASTFQTHTKQPGPLHRENAPSVDCRI
jgi:hypothetical protein